MQTTTQIPAARPSLVKAWLATPDRYRLMQPQETCEHPRCVAARAEHPEG